MKWPKKAKGTRKPAWTLFYYNHAVRQTVRKSCVALKAQTAEQREALLQDYTRKHKVAVGDEAKGAFLDTDYNHLVTDSLKLYRTHLDTRKNARTKNPEARAGISEGTHAVVSCTLDYFDRWLVDNNYTQLVTGRLDARHLQQFIDSLAVSHAARGRGRRQVRRRSASTLNRHRDVLKRVLNWLDGLNPPMFPRIRVLAQALKHQRTQTPQPVAFSPVQLAAFLEEALRREADDYRAPVVRQNRKLGARTAAKADKGFVKEIFEQAPKEKAATPVSMLFLLLVMTGMRLGEALALKWDDIDFGRGRSTIYAQKTGRERVLPLTGDLAGEVAPRFLNTLRRWKAAAGNRQFVLPHGELDHPVFPKSAWGAVAKAAKVPELGPQALRQNFASYLAATGVPATTASLWCGHAPDVQARFYLAQALDRLPGASVEEAMGLLGQSEEAHHVGTK
jgi:integrase